MSYSLSCTNVGFAWPDGAIVFDGLSFVAGPVRSGLVGRNGTGKSTLLKLIAGELTPRSGVVRHAGTLGYLPQDLTLDTALRVDQALGIHAVRRSIAAIETGDVDKTHFAVVGDDWDVEERALATLGKLGLDGIGLDRSVGELSGGEAVLLGLAGELLRRPDVLLLDEPTNNLDLSARRRLYDAVEAFRGALLVVSHDREMLDRMEQIGELRDGAISWYGGNLTAYEQALAVEQKAVMQERKRQAQVSAGKLRNVHTDRLESAREALTEAEALVHDDDSIRIDLPGTAVPPGRIVLRLEDVVLRAGADRADRIERGRQEHLAAHRRRHARTGGRHGGSRGAVPAAAAAAGRARR